MAKNTPRSIKSRAAKQQEANSRRKTKKQICIDLLMRPKGTSLAELKKATGWQPHSVRGFLSGTAQTGRIHDCKPNPPSQIKILANQETSIHDNAVEGAKSKKLSVLELILIATAMS